MSDLGKFVVVILVAVGWGAALSEAEWIQRTVEAQYLFVPAAALGAVIAGACAPLLLRIDGPKTERLPSLALFAIGCAALFVAIASLANRLGASSETKAEIYDVLFKGTKSGRAAIPYVQLRTKHGSSSFEVSYSDWSDTVPNGKVIVHWRAGNLGFDRVARIEPVR